MSHVDEALEELLARNPAARKTYEKARETHTHSESVILLLLAMEEGLESTMHELMRTRQRFSDMLNTSQSHFAVVRRN